MQEVRRSLLIALALLGGCHRVTKSNVTEVVQGDFKLVMWSREYSHSHVINVDICVASKEEKEVPTGKLHCFLHGYDFSGLTMHWVGPQQIQVTFTCGRLSHFSNYAGAYKDSFPTEFHIDLIETCNTGDD